jgi:citrate lyase subunit beta/citryl-CoA lyase
MFDRAWESEAEAIVFDLEDSVPAAEKKAARDAVSALKPAAGWTRPVFVRFNGLGSADFDADVRAVTGAPFAGVILPKVERASQVQSAEAKIAKALKLILLIETPGGVLRLAELVDCGVSRVAAFAFGGEDYRAGIGVTALDPVLADFARASVVNAAAAARLPAIDAPELQVDNADRVQASARRAKSLGFQSKFAIHPSQVAVIHQALGEGEDRAWAARALEAYERAVREGQGSVALDGRMIDEATMKRARDILKT